MAIEKVRYPVYHTWSIDTATKNSVACSPKIYGGYTRLAFEVFHDIQKLIVNLRFINETNFDLVEITQSVLVNDIVSKN